MAEYYYAVEFSDGDTLTAEKLNSLETDIVEASSLDYTPTEWQAGDIVDEEKLNKLASAYAGMALEYGDTDYTTVNWTTGEIVTAQKLNAMQEFIDYT